MANIQKVSGNSLSGLGIKSKPKVKLDAGVIKHVARPDPGQPSLLVLLDASGSMGWETNSGPTKMSLVWRALQKEIMPHLAGWEYKVASFSKGWASNQSVREISGSARAPSPDGDTPMLAALQYAWTYFAARPGRVILVTDGCPTDAYEAEIIAAAKLNPGIPVDTVGVGDAGYAYTYNPEFLRSLSEATGGIFSEVGAVRVSVEAALRQLSPKERPMLGMGVRS